MTLLQVEALDLAYSDRPACQDLYFSVGAAEIVTLIGANGAGKTTTMRGVSGLMPPLRGHIRFDGQDVSRLRAHERAALGIALVPEGRHVFPQLSIRENLEIGGFRHRRNPARLRQLIGQMVALFPRLGERIGQAAGTLSGGEQQMLVLCRALMSEPRLLCLDEPSLGLAPLVIAEIFQTIQRVHQGGMAILLVEQNAHYALETAQRGYVLQTGRIIAAGPTAELRADPRVITAYLGQRPAEANIKA